jgi:hypothetical protein
LAIIRTGLAFFAIGLTLFRYFGISQWSVFDGALVLMSVVLVIFGSRGYYRAQASDRRLAELLTTDRGLVDVV